MNFKKIIVLNLFAFSLSISAADYEGRKTPCCNVKRSAKALALALISVFSLGNAESSVAVVPQAISVQQLTNTGVICYDAQGRFFGKSAFGLNDKLCINEGEAYVRGSIERLFNDELVDFAIRETICPVKRSSHNARVGQIECIPGARHIKVNDIHGNQNR